MCYPGSSGLGANRVFLSLRVLYLCNRGDPNNISHTALKAQSVSLCPVDTVLPASRLSHRTAGTVREIGALQKPARVAEGEGQAGGVGEERTRTQGSASRVLMVKQGFSR